MVNKKIMVVDDDEIHQFTTKMMLQRVLGMTNVIGFTSPVKALAFVQENQNDVVAMPELILLDINMPIMDGFEFLDFMEKSIVSNKPTVFMVSSSISPQDRSRAFAYQSVKEYLSKPVNTTELEEKMKKHLINI